MRFYIGWREELSICYKSVEICPQWTCFKTVRLTVISNELKWTIFANGGLGLLQMVSKPEIGQCAS